MPLRHCSSARDIASKVWWRHGLGNLCLEIWMGLNVLHSARDMASKVSGWIRLGLEGKPAWKNCKDCKLPWPLLHLTEDIQKIGCTKQTPTHDIVVRRKVFQGKGFCEMCEPSSGTAVSMSERQTKHCGHATLRTQGQAIRGSSTRAPPPPPTGRACTPSPHVEGAQQETYTTQHSTARRVASQVVVNSAPAPPHEEAHACLGR